MSPTVRSIPAAAPSAAPRRPAPPGRPVATPLVDLRLTPAYYARGRRYLLQRDPRLAAIMRRIGPCRIRAYQHGDPFSALVETIVSQQLSTRVADVIFGRLCTLCGPPDASGNGRGNGNGNDRGRANGRGTGPGDSRGNGAGVSTGTGVGTGVGMGAGTSAGTGVVAAGNSGDRHTRSNGMTPARMLAFDQLQLRAAGLSGAKARYVHELATKVADGTLRLDDLDHLPDEEVTRVLSQVKGIGPWSTHMFLIFRLHRPDVWPIGDLGIVKALQRFHGLRKVPKATRLERMGEIWRPYRSLAAWYLWASLDLSDDEVRPRRQP